MDGTKQVLDRIGGRVGRFSFNQKVLLGAVVAAGALSLVIFTLWLRQAEKAVLFTNLSAEDAARAIEELGKQNVQADLANGGTTIMVPEGDVHRLRVDLAARGIPSSGVVGFELFDGKQYGLTEFLQDVNFKRALEGELTKTIQSLAGISAARVHLVIPKPSIFKRMQTEATASVVLSLAPSARVGDDQIHGIQALVAGSVEGLTAENVTVLDQRGAVLSRSYDPAGPAGDTEGQLALKKEIEGYLTQKAQTMLAEVLGGDKAIVRVDATLNFERLQTNREIYDPAVTVVRSEERNESTEAQGEGTSESSVTNYEINKTLQTIVGEVGNVKQLSVSVFVDGHYAPPAGGGDPAYAPLPEEELRQIERIVQTAVGLNPARGDRIEVVNMQFQGREPVAAPAGGPLGQPWLQNLPDLIGKVLLFAAGAVLLLALRRNLGRLLAAGGPAPRQAVAAGAPGGAAGGPLPSIRDAGAPDTAERMISEVKDYATENPEAMAELVQAWMNERE